jgi:hypothetical protein
MTNPILFTGAAGRVGGNRRQACMKRPTAYAAS